MKIIRGINNYISTRPIVATIGNFDGVHLGHKSIIRLVHQKALEYKAVSLVISFQPTPNEYFYGKDIPDSVVRLNSFKEQVHKLEKLKIDKGLWLNFNEQLAKMSAQDFVKEVLVDKLNIKCLIVGSDFKFGSKRQGDIKFLESMGQEHGFDVIKAESFATPAVEDMAEYLEKSRADIKNADLLRDIRISSSLIRKLLQDGDVCAAARILGEPYSIIGKVVHGDKLASAIGFPTANICLSGRKKLNVSGVFMVRMCIEQACYFGVANVGTKPTVDGKELTLEVHLFNGNLNLYDKIVKVEFFHKVRDEKKFNNLSELTQQISSDVNQARDWLEQNFTCVTEILKRVSGQEENILVESELEY